MGVLNALTLLDEGGAGPEFSQSEMIAMARQNAQRLHRALATLLDLAALESGTFHARLREIDLVRLVKNRLGAHERMLRENGLKTTITTPEALPILGDPQKLGRAVDLCFELAMTRAAKTSPLAVTFEGPAVRVAFELNPGTESEWDSAWSQGVAGFEGGVGSPTSAFAGVVQSERAFLSRTQEGLGSEFLLIHQILRLHGGRFESHAADAHRTLVLALPSLSSEQALRAVLMSRAYEVSTELGAVALVLIAVPRGEAVEKLADKIKASLFRSSDAAYALPGHGQVALVLDDCKPEDALRLVQRLEKALGAKLRVGVAQCPSDGVDPSRLIGLASERLSARTP